MWDCRHPSTKWKVSVSVCVELSLPTQVVSYVNGNVYHQWLWRMSEEVD